MIVADNVVRAGAVADPSSHDPSVRGVRRFLDVVGAEPLLEEAVGTKGYDGFAVAVVTS